MTANTPLLTLKLEGSEVRAGWVPVTDLIHLLTRIQLCVKRVGQALSLGESNDKQGRMSSEVETSCSLDMVALDQGSALIGLDLHTEQHPLNTLFGEEEPLGRSAVRTLVEGVSHFSEGRIYPIKGFDIGVLRSLSEAAEILSSGVESIEFSYQGEDGSPQSAHLDNKTRERITQSLGQDMVNQMTIQGVIREINLERGSCQILTLGGEAINCNFERAMEQDVKAVLDLMVEITGEARLVRSRGTTLKVKELKINKITSADAEESQPLTAKDLLASSFAGGWADRTDIDDVVDFARQLREQAWQRKND